MALQSTKLVIDTWHLNIWRLLQERWQYLPSSMLLVGSPGTNLANLGMEFAGMLLCETTTDERPCGGCGSCHLFAQGVHPDLHIISTEEFEGVCESRFRMQSRRYTDLDSAKRGSRATLRTIITVDQIRAVTDALNKSPGIGPSKICLINPAEALNLNGANALLKSLEEPTDRTYFLLLSSFPGNLPATIRSRCSRINLDNPTNDESIEWLTTLHGVDFDVAQQLISHGFGPYEVLEMNTKEYLDAYQALVHRLVELMSGNISAGRFSRQAAIYEVGLTLKVIQGEIYRGLRRSVQSEELFNSPVVISPELIRNFRNVLLSIYFAIGHFLNLPKRSVDDQLFLEHIAQKLSFSLDKGLDS